MPPEYRRGTFGGHQRNSAATGVEFRQLTAIFMEDRMTMYAHDMNRQHVMELTGRDVTFTV
ncbi:MAG: hypothetical protein CL719_02295 [Chloroflexi bacterium]|nr:hypothetical protein [Chloroflexota bacterium]